MRSRTVVAPMTSYNPAGHERRFRAQSVLLMPTCCELPYRWGADQQGCGDGADARGLRDLC
jgi:hypothetical protein